MRVVFYLVTTVNLVGCAFFNNPPPLPQIVTAAVDQNTTHIFWLDKQQQAISLIEYVTLPQGYYQARYRWQQGQLRDLALKGEIKADGKLKHHDIVLRYYANGEAVYQQFKLDGELMPLHQESLKFYYHQAEDALALAEQQAKKPWQFFQGHLNDSIFIPCDNPATSRLTFSQTLPEHSQLPLNGRFFIAALGEKKGNRYQVKQILQLANSEHACRVPPVFID